MGAPRALPCGAQVWQGARIHDLALRQGKLGEAAQLVAACERGVRLCPIERPPGGDAAAPPTLRFPSELWIEESDSITSLCLARDGRHALISTAREEIRLWDLATQTLLQRYTGHRQGRLVIRACFGGADDSLVLSGSEDSQVYTWHRHSGALLHVLPGHSGAVNAVAWRPGAAMFASASDDGTVRLWAP